jgi:hypothetical protein
MALVPQIRTTLSRIGAKFADGAIEYRRLTSAPTASPRVYGAWAVLALSRIVDQEDEQTRDMETGHWYRSETCQLRVPYEVGIVLSIRDQVRTGETAGAGTSNIVWSIRSTVDAADGVVRAYNLYRRTPMLADPRQGGI